MPIDGLIKKCVAYATNGVGKIRAASIDFITRNFVIIDHSHHEMHEGDHYFLKTYIDNAVGAATDYFAFTTPNNGKRIHAKTKIAPDVDYIINIYEGSVITGGTPITGFNNDRDSINTHDLSIVVAPAHTTPGTIIWAARTGGGKDPVGVSPASTYEIIAATNTVYVFEIIKQATASTAVVDVDFWWYEHTPKD